MKIRKQNQFTSYQFWSYIKIIPIENNFVLSDAEGKTSVPLLKDGIADLPLLRTLLVTNQKSREPSLWEVIDPFGLLAEASLAASRTLWWWLIVCLNFTLDTKALFCWYKHKSYGSSTSSWKPWRWMMRDLIFTMRDIYINCNMNHLQNSEARAEAPILKMSSHGTGLNWLGRLYQSAGKAKSCAMKKVTPFWV